jgi:hypothetical protein
VTTQIYGPAMGYFLTSGASTRISRSVLYGDKFIEFLEVNITRQKRILKSLGYNAGEMQALVNEKYDK